MQNTFNKWLLFIFTAIIMLSSSGLVRAQQKKFKVVIDAGHGGHDTGTTGTGRMKKKEKDIALAVAKLVGKKLSAYKDIQPILTRRKDVFLKLYERAEIANKNKADLFVSIHCNANRNSHAAGSETYVLGVHRNKDNLEVAKRENAVIKLESDNKLHYEGFDPDHPETFIGLTLMQEAYLDQSIMLASLIQKAYKKFVHKRDRSVQQAGFAVLRLTYMPSVLTEIGFLTNPAEERFLNSKAGQNKIATAIANAIVQYKNYIRYNTPVSPQLTKKSASTRVHKQEKNIVKLAKHKKSHQHSELASTSKKNKPITVVDKKNGASKKPTHKKTTKDIKYKGVIFKVQLFATKKKIPLLPKNFRGLKDLSMIKEGNLYKYFAGHTSDFEKILEVKGEARYKSFSSAFIVAYTGNKRIPLSEALKK